MNTRIKGTILTLFGGICWGMSGIVGKILFDEKGLTAQWLVTSRLLFGGMLLLLIAFCKKRGEIFDIWKNKKSAGSTLMFAVFGMLACQLTYFLCIDYSNPATATVLQYTSPVIIMLLCLAMDRRRPEWIEMLVLVIVIVSVFLMSTHGNIHSLSLSKRTLIMGFLAALTVVFYNMWPTRLLKAYGSEVVIGWSMFLGGVFLFPFSKFWEVPGFWGWQTVVLLGIVILFGTVCSFTCYLKGVVYLGPVQSSLYACVEPLVSAILTVIVLHEDFKAADYAGMAGILGGVTALAIHGIVKESKKERKE